MFRTCQIETMFADRDALVVKLVTSHDLDVSILKDLSVGSRWFDHVNHVFREEAIEAHRRCLAGSNPEIVVEFDHGSLSRRNPCKLQLAGIPSSSEEINLIAISVMEVPATEEGTPLSVVDDNYFFAELEAIYSSANVGFCLIDRSLTYVRINEVLAQINGIPRSSHLGKKVSEVVPPIYEHFKSIFEQLFEHGEPLLNLKIDGPRDSAESDHIYCLASFLPLRDAAGQVKYISIVVEEETALVHEKRARMIAEERTNQLIETCNHSTVVVGNNNTLIKVNQIILQLTGYGADELIGQKLSILVDEASEESLNREIEERFLSSGTHTDWQLRSKHGQHFWVDMASIPITNIFTGEFEGLCLVFSDISAEKAVEIELKRSEERHAIASQIAHLGHFEWNQETQIIHWSPTLYEILEVDPVPGLDLHFGFRSRVHPHDLARLTNTVEEAIRTQTDYHIEFRLLLPSGKLKYVEEFGRIRIDQTSSGNQVFLHGTIQDITAISESRAELQVNEERMRLALEASSTEAWDYDWNSRVLTISPRLWKFAGIDPTLTSPRKALGRMLKLFSDKGRRRFLRAVLRSIVSGKRQEVEVRLRLGSSKRREFAILWEVRREDGSVAPVRIIGIIRDISARKQLERFKAESEIQFKKILDTALEGAWFFNQKGKTVRINDSLSRILGYTASEMMGKSYLRFVAVISKRDAINFFKRCAQGVGGSSDLCFVHKNGFEVWVIVSCSPIHSSRRTYKGLFCLITDITARKKLEEDLIRAKEEAESASRIKSQFLANMSHELRTPIAAILGFSEILDEPEFKNDNNTFMIEGIRNNSEHMVKLIDDVLDIAKIEAGKITIHRISYSPEKLLSEVCQICSARAESSGIRLVSSITGPFPRICKLDPTRLRQILINLVNNAIKFSEPGTTVSLEMMVQFKVQSPSLKFIVRDEGIGISDDHQEMLFKPFSQVDSSMTRKHGGVGLGLALSSNIAKAMNGSISLVSVEGKGSIFTVEIPISGSSESEVNEIEQYGRKGLNATSDSDFFLSILTGPKRILVVEDNAGLAQIIKFHLERVGLKVELCGDGITAVEMVSEGDFDLILMDIQLPRMDGNEAIRTIRREGFSNPILALSAHAKTSDRNAALKSGANAYLIKPMSRDALVKAVRKHLTRNNGSIK